MRGRDVESKMWTEVMVVLSRRGIDEGSQAIYCLECVKKRTRPVGYGLSWSSGVFTTQARRNSLLPNHTVPYGTARLFASPGSKLPGYLHLVPTGRESLAPVGSSDFTSRISSTSTSRSTSTIKSLPAYAERSSFAIASSSEDPRSNGRPLASTKWARPFPQTIANARSSVALVK